MTKTIVMLGESTTWGIVGSRPWGPACSPTTGVALQAILAKEMTTCNWLSAQVITLAVPGAKTNYWAADVPPPVFCQWAGATFGPLLPAACAAQTPLIEVFPQILNGVQPDLYLITMGVNDIPNLIDPSAFTPQQTLDYLDGIIQALLPVPALLSPPVMPVAGTPWYNHAFALRELERARGITGVDWPTLPLSDYLHPTGGGYAAMAGLWSGRICPQT